MTNLVEDKINYLGTALIDPDTGELLWYVKDDRKQPPVKHLPPEGEIYVGIDLPYPSECVLEEDMHKVMRAIDGYYRNKPKVNTDFLLDLVAEGFLSAQQLKLLKYVCENLSGWNYCITTVKDIKNSTGIGTKNFSRVLDDLIPEYIRIQHRDKPKRGCLVLKVNPQIAWKGDLAFVEESTKRWFSPS